MSVFKNLPKIGTTEETEYAQKKLLETDAYIGTTKLAYITKSGSSEATAIRLIIDVEGTEVKKDYWFLDKNGSATAINKDGKTDFISGYKQAIVMIRLLTEDFNKEFDALEQVKKTIEVYDTESKSKVLTPTDTLPELMNKPIGVCVTQIEKPHYKKEDTLVKENEIFKLFHHESGQTYNEALKNEEAKAVEVWVEANKGKVYSKQNNTNKISGLPDRKSVV